jgi:hypothetical protein
MNIILTKCGYTVNNYVDIFTNIYVFLHSTI